MTEAARLALRAPPRGAPAPDGRCTPPTRTFRSPRSTTRRTGALWHAATLLREHRGDGHIAVLQNAELDALEALVSHTASGHGMNPAWVMSTRGYNEQDWTAAQQRLTGRGLLDGEGELTERGTELRKHLEEETDRLDRRPYELLGAEGVARLTELAGGFTQAAIGAGAFPADLLGKG